jgi:putative transcriptional regulator
MNCGMIKTKINELLAAQGKSLYWLSKQADIAYPTLLKLRDSKTESISFRVLENICNVLDCELGDVLVRAPESKPISKKKISKK